MRSFSIIRIIPLPLFGFVVTLLFVLVSHHHMNIATGFLPYTYRQRQLKSRTNKQQQQQQQLFGISEWRAAIPTSSNDDSSDDDFYTPYNRLDQTSNNSQQIKNRTILLLPFSKDEALLPGETTTIILREGRYFDLLDEATSTSSSSSSEKHNHNHHNIIGTILLGDDDYLPVMPLCEIIEYKLDAWPRGGVTATVTLKCVSRAILSQNCPPAAASIIQFKPFMKGYVNELIDDNDDELGSSSPSSFSQDDKTYIEIANELIDDIEQLLEQKGELSTTTTKSSSKSEKTTTTTTYNKRKEEEETNASSSSPYLLYQQHYWLVLSTLGYSPTSLLTRDPFSSNRKKEIEAASWSAFVALKKEICTTSKSSSSSSNSNYIYEAIRTTNVLDRLRLALRASVEGNVALTTATNTINNKTEDDNDDDDDDENLSSGNNDKTTTFPTSGSSNSFYDLSGFE